MQRKALNGYDAVLKTVLEAAKQSRAAAESTERLLSRLLSRDNTPRGDRPLTPAAQAPGEPDPGAGETKL